MVEIYDVGVLRCTKRLNSLPGPLDYCLAQRGVEKGRVWACKEGFTVVTRGTNLCGTRVDLQHTASPRCFIWV